MTLRDNGALTATSAINIMYGTLSLDNTGLSNNTSRISSTAPINLSSGVLSVAARQTFDAQTVGPLTLDRGSSAVTITPIGETTSGAYALTMSNLSRDANGGAVINFTNSGGTLGGTTNTPTAGANPQMFLSKINSFSFDQTKLVNGIIGGWAVVNGSEFATYKDTLGIGVKSNTGAGFVAYESTDTSTATALMNVNDGTNRTLAGARVINSFRSAAGAAQTITLGSNTAPSSLTIGSGGLLTNANFAINFNAANISSKLTSRKHGPLRLGAAEHDEPEHSNYRQHRPGEVRSSHSHFESDGGARRERHGPRNARGEHNAREQIGHRAQHRQSLCRYAGQRPQHHRGNDDREH